MSYFNKDTNTPDGPNLKKDINDIHHKDSYVDIIISLTKNGEIDLSVFIDTTNDLAKKSMFEYTQKCAEFLNIAASDKLKSQITGIVLDQIKNENNQILIENIIMFWALMDKESKDKKEIKQNRTYIPPSEVFSRHIRQ
jgi:hypothetical protein